MTGTTYCLQCLSSPVKQGSNFESDSQDEAAVPNAPQNGNGRTKSGHYKLKQQALSY
jgi:hypothetical protein